MIRIVAAEAVPITFRLREGYRIAGHHFTSAENVLLKISTSDGHSGYGCAAPFEEVTGESPAASLAALRDILIPLARDADPESPESAISQAAAAAPGAPAARAALDMALFDLRGKRAGVPLHRLLGSVRTRLLTSVTLGIEDDLAASLDRARRYVAEGFRVLKIKVGEDWEADARLVAALRAAFGAALVIRADANQGYDEACAARFLRAAEPSGLELLEQPTPAGDLDVMRRLREVSRIPIMADESVVTEPDATRVLAAGAADLLNIKLMKAGGVMATLAIGRRAAAAGVGVMIGCNDESRISIAAGLHAALASPPAERADLDGHLDLQDDVARGGVRLRDGFIEAGDEPGLGVSADF
ncbi:MAG TPA: enolase C-terminal domain-like protein [Patescibacteria group bacterium]|nr:enolase C-terminal domain-like protein [Patescibacteria group bacterium]